MQTRELERPATVMIYGSKPILGVSILALYLCMADNKLNSTTTPTLSLCYPGRGDPGIIEMKKKTQARSPKTVRGRERSWSRFGAQLSMNAAGAISRDANSLIGHTCSVLVSSATPFNGVMSDTAFSDRQQRCPRYHHRRFPAMVRTRMPSRMMGTTCKLSPVMLFDFRGLFCGRCGCSEKRSGEAHIFFYKRFII